MPRKKKDQNSPQPQSSAAKVADQLRQHILACAEGDFLGNEDTLLAQYGVSRPTFRQSVRMLELEQLLETRRGPDGGYYARKPSMKSVGRIAATYLESRNTRADQLIDAGNILFAGMIHRAATSTDETGRAALRNFQQHLAVTDTAALPFEDFHRNELKFRSLLANLANNPALELMIDVLYQTAMDEAEPGPSTFVHKTERRTHWKRLNLRLIEAILNGEADVAVALTEPLYQMLSTWRAEDKAEFGQ